MSAAERAADSEARRRAQTDFAAPLALEAGAGTGKTTVLVGRILAWCLGPGWERVEADGDASRDSSSCAVRVLDGVVAVTFTEAAAAEMASRMARSLHEIRNGAAPVGLCTEAWPADAGIRRERAAALLGELDRLQVSTIHAFCRSLLSEYPLDAGLHPHFEVDARGLVRGRIAREVVAERIESLGDDGDEDLILLVEHGFGAPELADTLATLLEESVSSSDLASDPLAPARVAEFANRMEEALAGFCRAMVEGRRSLPDHLKAAQLCDCIAQIHTRWAADPPRDAGALTRFQLWLRNLEFQIDKLGGWGQGRFGGVQETDAFASSRALIAAAAALKPLLLRIAETDFTLLAAFHRVAPPLLAEAERRLAAAGNESFQGLLERTRDLLRSNAAASARVRQRIDQLMVDEFQDTDSVQCEILSALTDPASSSAEPPGLFLVGDPKQSIYGWRNADLAAYEGFVESSGAEVLQLQVNHRSVPAILEEVARAIGPVMVREPGLQPDFAPLLPSERNSESSAGPGPEPVEYWVSCGFDQGAPIRVTSEEATRIEAEALVRDLHQVRSRHGAAWKDCAVLVSSRGRFDVLLDALRRADIPYAADRDIAYYRRREVRDAIALVRCVLDPNDQIALVTALRSSWVGVPDAAWMPLQRRDFARRLRHAMLAPEPDLAPLRTLCREAAAEVRGAAIPGLSKLGGWEALLIHAVEVLVDLRRSFRSESFDRFVERVRTLSLLEVCEAARYQGGYRIANLRRFFRELAEWLEASGGDLSDVLRELRRIERDDRVDDEGRVADPAEDVVRVMTIHAAKGLDFEHVYLPQLHRQRSDDARAWEAGRMGGPLEFQLTFGRGRSAGVIATLRFDELREQRRAVRGAEMVRTLYVAMTRAKRRLVLAGHLEDRGQGDRSHADLLVRSRRASLDQALARSAEGRDEYAVAWSFPALGSPPAPSIPTPGPAPPGPELASLRDQGHLLETERLVAARRALRRFGASVTQTAAERRESRTDETAFAVGPSQEARSAAVVGTATHRLLELFDWAADRDLEWERRRDQLHREIERNLGAGASERAAKRAEELLDTLVRGPLWERLHQLQPHLIGRELPVLLAPGAGSGEPTGYVSGVIDLLYRDPASGALVVADFKTDRVADADPAALRERAKRYRDQGAAYLRAVREGVEEGRAPAPRFEIWFLDASTVVPIECEAGRGVEPGLRN